MAGLFQKSRGALRRITMPVPAMKAASSRRPPSPSVGTALLETLSDALGGAFTPATREAWGAMYAHVARTMQAQAQLQH